MKEFFLFLFSIQVLATILSFYRLWNGPGQADRVLIFDLLTSIGISMMLAAGIYFGSPLFIDVAIVMALISFAGTIGFTYFLEKEKRQ